VVGDQIEIGAIFRGIGWFILMDFLTIAILIMFPQIVLWFPNAIRI
jgi:TRAP-type C4-dicarboxylate transport system permease large subunit